MSFVSAIALILFKAYTYVMCTEKELGLMFTQEATFLTMMSTEVQGRLYIDGE